MLRGSITITLSLVIVIFISFFLTILAGIQLQAVNMRTNLIAQMGMDSIFAEYNKELLDQYNLFYIDTSYGSEHGGIDYIVERIRSIMERNTKVSESNTELPSTDLVGVSIESIVPITYHIASDYAGYSVREQAISYQKDITGISIVEHIANELDIMKMFELDTRNIAQENRELESQASASLPEEYGFQIVNLLAFFRNELGTISEAEIDLSQSTFYRVRDIGVYENDDISTSITGIADIAEEVIFQEYLLNHCSYYGNELEKSHLKYQIEYLIAGNQSDSANLNSILTRLLAIREVSNFIYLLGDQEKINTVKVVSTAIDLLLPVPNMEPIIRLLLQGIWATYESSLDIKSLIKGEKVPLLKSDATWKSDFGDGLFMSPISGREDNSSGLSYKEYLHLLLIVTNRDEKIYRFMDMIELDIQKTEYNENFRMDFCMDCMKLQISFTSSLGYSRTWEKKYRYGI